MFELPTQIPAASLSLLIWLRIHCAHVNLNWFLIAAWIPPSFPPSLREKAQQLKSPLQVILTWEKEAKWEKEAYGIMSKYFLISGELSVSPLFCSRSWLAEEKEGGRTGMGLESTRVNGIPPSGFAAPVSPNLSQLGLLLALICTISFSPLCCNKHKFKIPTGTTLEAS